jgi:hypothetical protein
VAAVAADGANKASIVLSIINLLRETKATYSIQDRDTSEMGSFLLIRWGVLEETKSAQHESDTKEEVSSGAITFS